MPCQEDAKQKVVGSNPADIGEFYLPKYQLNGSCTIAPLWNLHMCELYFNCRVHINSEFVFKNSLIFCCILRKDA